MTTTGVLDTYDYDFWTESEDEDLATLLTEDDLSSDGEPEPKRRRSEEPNGSKEKQANSALHPSTLFNAHLNQSRLYMAFCVSAVLAVWLSLVAFSH